MMSYQYNVIKIEADITKGIGMVMSISIKGMGNNHPMKGSTVWSPRTSNNQSG
jgi:hypothetical protein